MRATFLLSAMGVLALVATPLAHAQTVNETFTVTIDGGNFGFAGPLSGQVFSGSFDYDAGQLAVNGFADVTNFVFTFPYAGSPTTGFAYPPSFDGTSLSLFYAPGPVGSPAFAIGPNIGPFAYGTTIAPDNSFGDAGFGSVSYSSAAVPEPGTVALLVGMGLSGAGFLARRKRAGK